MVFSYITFNTHTNTYIYVYICQSRRKRYSEKSSNLQLAVDEFKKQHKYMNLFSPKLKKKKKF